VDPVQADVFLLFKAGRGISLKVVKGY